MGIADECARDAQHATWLRYWSDDGDRSGEPPVPGYKDCVNCPLRKQADTTEERRSLCASCVWEAYPVAPSERYAFALRMAGFGDYVLARSFDEMTFEEHRDINTVKRYQEARSRMW